MTRVEFIFNVEDKLVTTAQLCERALAKGRQLTILSTSAQQSSQFQRQLWQHKRESFLANAVADDGNSMHSPIYIQSLDDALLQDDVLINFDSEVPLFFSRFRYVVELVGLDEADKVCARIRYKFYRDRGYDIKTTNTIND